MAKEDSATPRRLHNGHHLRPDLSPYRTRPRPHPPARRTGRLPRCAPWPRRAAPSTRCAWPCWPRSTWPTSLRRLAAPMCSDGHARAAHAARHCSTKCSKTSARRAPELRAFSTLTVVLLRFRHKRCPNQERAKNVSHLGYPIQDLQFFASTPTIRNRNRPAKQVGGQRWMNQHSLNRGSTRIIGSVCRVRQSGMPNEPRRAPPS